jgi:MOSC domain-containing protein YiiM
MDVQVVSVNISTTKHVSKTAVAEVELRIGLGVVGDAHAGPGIRQVSLLAEESIQRQRDAAGGKTETATCSDVLGLLVPGGFAENITTRGLEVSRLPIGTRLRVGADAVLEISKIGKACHRHCEIYHKLGDCVMPREGVFAKVICDGTVRPNDEVCVEERGDSDSQ